MSENIAESAERDDGGSAFPVIPPVDETGRTAVGYPYPESGMSLRDWLAGQALVAMATPGALKAVADQGGEPASVMAETAYVIADAMIAKRAS